MTFPRELTQLSQWILWRAENQGTKKKPIKKPYQVSTNFGASSTNVNHWTSYKKAQSYVTSWNGTNGYGLGFVTTENDGLTLVDLDNCFNLKGILKSWALPLLACPTFAEISPSGRGLHLFFAGYHRQFKSSFTDNDNESCEVATYVNKRYFTMTGKRYEYPNNDLGYKISPLKSDISTFLDTYNHKQKLTPRTISLTRTHRQTNLSDEDIIRIASNARNGYKFKRLFRGDTLHGTASEDDMALARILNFYTGNDYCRTERIMWDSGLKRDKWKRRKEYYLVRTIQKAHSQNVFTPRKPNSQTNS